MGRQAISKGTRQLDHTTPFKLSDAEVRLKLGDAVAAYLSLLDWTGRQLRAAGKGGSIPAHLALILARLPVRSNLFVDAIRWFGRVVGRAAQLTAITSRTGCRSLKGMERCAAVFG